MKKIIFTSFVIFIFLFSCESILDEEPKSIIDPERFYRTETDGIAAIAGIYSHLFDGDAFGVQIDIYFEVNHDLITPTRALGAGQEFFAYNWDENTPRVRVIWQRLYRAINDANLLIKNVANADFDEKAKNETIAEGIFLRSFIYYYLTAIYGDVPYITEPVDENNFDQNSMAGRTSATEIRQEIIEDLTAVEDDLPIARRSDFPQRATQWAAKTLKLKTYLWLKDYANAVATAQDIVNNSGHSLLPDYGNIFRARL